ncbi:Protein of uncharacterised function (DUF3667) [Brevundimonas vesicularis]|uniref:Protein of uncharacterized function (DUF3667) n=1 Tax=Brevundimonas vesicularis TaxID=41276 RepID=A0A2X1CZ33_BREVE|nr:DUF3667 domain-containing protein [Brevundimonas vesicularis]SPU51726.1 Protein of uncharacterised function (DUF3667) [Brevundimonas vesicularis]
MDIEGAGAVVTSGLVAGAIEKPTGKAGEDHAHGACSDCGAETSGNFCANCGQPTHVHRSLLHLGEELLHGVMHFDARIWRTLPLLWANPGKLTREWVEGKRTRYVSPLAIFLFTLFVMFFALSFMPHPESKAGGGGLAERIASQRVGLAEAEKALVQMRAESGAQPDPTMQMAINAGQKLVDDRRAALARLEVEQRDGRADGLKPGSWQASIKDMATEEAGETKIKVMGKDAEKEGHGVVATVLKKLQNPDLAVYKLQQTMYKFAFLLVPLSIPFVALLFLWKRGFTLYDHGVFVLYSLTFMAMLLMLMVVSATIAGWLGGIVITLGVLAVPVHVFAQMKGAYSLSWFSALWRTIALLVFCNIVVGLFVTAIVYLGLGH